MLVISLLNHKRSKENKETFPIFVFFASFVVQIIPIYNFVFEGIQNSLLESRKLFHIVFIASD